MIKICPNCGSQMPATVKFCTHCGFNLADVTPISETAAQTPARPVVPEAQAPVNPAPKPQADPNVAPPKAQPERPQPMADPTTANQTPPNEPASAPHYQNQAENQSNSFTNNAQQTQQNFNQNQQNYNQYQQTYTNPQPNPNMEATKRYASNYWSFLVASLKHPFTMNKAYNQYFGLISFGLATLLYTLALAATIGHVKPIQAVLTYANTGFSLYVQFFLFILALYALQIAVAFLVTHVFLGDRRYNFWQFMNLFAVHTNINVFISGLVFLFSLIGVSATNAYLTYLLIMVAALFFGAGFIATIFTAQSTNNFDRIYAYALGSVLLAIGFIVIFSILGTSIIDLITRSSTNILDELYRTFQ
ncbi:MAG: zinc-ribbon domain-containing protein [Lactobacillus sp.]|nr:zinc-ribbon domain-containing protein [Lactobacillus sp.]